MQFQAGLNTRVGVVTCNYIVTIKHGAEEDFKVRGRSREANISVGFFLRARNVEKRRCLTANQIFHAIEESLIPVGAFLIRRPYRYEFIERNARYQGHVYARSLSRP